MCKLFLFLSFFLSHYLNSQTWFQNNDFWHYSMNYAFTPEVGYATMNVTGDSLIGDKSANILTQIAYDASGASREWEKIVVYEDGQRVYRLLDGQFRLLYDFTAEVGDTLNLYNMSYNTDTIIYLRIDSLETVEIAGKNLVAQYVRAIDKGDYGSALTFSGWNIQTIGNENNFIPVNQLDCDEVCVTPLRCYTSEGITYQQGTLPCDTIITGSVSVSDIIPSSTIKIFPNPVQAGMLRVSLNLSRQFKKIGYRVVGINGETMHTGRIYSVDEFEIDVNAFANGIYFLQIYGDTVTESVGQRIFIKAN